MRLLLDSHICFWFALKQERLTTAELAIIRSADANLAFSSIAIWELRIKWNKRFVSGERKGEANPLDVLNYLRRIEITSIDLTPELAATKLIAPIGYGDPFDALLLTVAQETDRLLLTRDEKLRGHPQAYHAS